MRGKTVCIEIFNIISVCFRYLVKIEIFFDLSKSKVVELSKDGKDPFLMTSFTGHKF
jgi:hypothetical protein